MGKIKILIVFVTAYLIIFPSALSAELSTAQFEIIRIAYMNGYSDAMLADLDTIKALKEDQVKLKKNTLTAANGYMSKVSILNQDGRAARNQMSASYSPLSF